MFQKIVCCTVLAVSVVTGMVGCAPDISASTYNATSQTGQAGRVVKGGVVSSRVVNVASNDGVGKIAGGLAGAVAGTALGGGSRTPILGAIGGAVLGGMAGNALEGKLSKQQVVEYIIKTIPGGALISVTQGPDV